MSFDEDPNFLTLVFISNFVSIALAVHNAYYNATSGYELSIYAGTPDLFWLLIGYAIFSSLFALIITSSDSILPYVSLCLSISVLTLLPLIRGYHFFGEGDSLSHLGFMRHIMTDSPNLGDFLYSGLHTLAATVSFLSGLPDRNSLLLVAVVITLSSILSFPLLTREIFPRAQSFRYGFLVGLMLLPLNPINVSLWPHPTSQAIFFSIFPLYLAFTIIKRSRGRWHMEVILIITLLALFTYHPQQLLNTLVVISVLAIGLSIFGYDRTKSPYLLMIVVIIMAILLWIHISTNATFVNAFRSSLVTASSDAATGHREAGSIFDSLASLGTSLYNFAIKIGLKYILLLPISLLGILGLLKGYYHSSTLFLAVGGFFLSPFFAYFLLAGNANQWGRYVGYLTILFAISASLGFALLAQKFSLDQSNLLIRSLLACFLGAALLGSLILIYPSPFILHSNGHVSEGMYDGYTDSINYANTDDPIYDIRSRAPRYQDARDYENRFSSRYRAPDHFHQRDLPAFISSDGYLAVTAADHKRDIILYQGFRYDTNDFKYLRSDDEIHYVYGNGEFNFYRITNQSNTSS